MSSLRDLGHSAADWHPEEVQRWEFGRRKLAGMMGVEGETFTERGVDQALRYLLPTRLSARDARPLMKVSSSTSLPHQLHHCLHSILPMSLTRGKVRLQSSHYGLPSLFSQCLPLTPVVGHWRLPSTLAVQPTTT